MAAGGELSIDFSTGLNLYSQVRERQSGGMVWRSQTSGFEVYNSASGNLASYFLSMTEQGTSAHYVGNAPTPLPAGTYDVSVRNRLNLWYADTDPFVGAGQLEWNGSRAIPLADLSTSGQVATFAPTRPTKGYGMSGFSFKMVSSADHVTPVTSGLISGQVSRNGSIFGALQSGTLVGGYTELGFGFYSVNLTSGDMNADVVSLHFTCAGADARDMVILTDKG